MLRTYPDFAFSTATQVVLFFVNIAVTTFSFFMGTNVILSTLQKRAAFGRKLLFNAICAVGLQILVVYGVAFVNGVFIERVGGLSIGAFGCATSVITPFSYFALCWMGMRILRLTKYQSMRFARVLYTYFVFSQILLRIGGTFIFPRISDPRGWNYLRDILAITSGTMVAYLVYRLAMAYVRRRKFCMAFPDNLVIPNARRELLKGFLAACAVYGATVLCLEFPTGTGYEVVYMLVALLCFLLINLMVGRNNVDQIRIDNKDAHIAMLTESIEGFRAVKHDFHNILQTYSGYLFTKDHSGLTRYHQKVVNTMVTSEAAMEVSIRMQEYPAFFSLIGAKIELAKQKQVSFQVSLPYMVRQADMEPLDFCRVMGCLIDNAIDAAAETATRRVELSCQPKRNGGRVLILSNDVASPVDPEQIFTPGFTTKPDHMGLGLPHAREILYRHGNCTLNFSNYMNSFTVYFEVRPMAMLERVS